MNLKIQEIIDGILAETPYKTGDQTVDTVKSGNAQDGVQGIVTTFLASYEVLEQAVAAGANFIITHEPTFYNHRDETEWLASDPVYMAKRRYIDEHKLVIWRFHDYWHKHRPDGITTGFVRAVGWQSYLENDGLEICNLPSMPLAGVVTHLKRQLGATGVRVIGDDAMICRRAALLLGACGGHPQITALGRPDVDVVICGEVHEWETNEYVRDAVRLGAQKALIVLGHAASEEAGMSYLAERLRERIPGVIITHVATGDALRRA